MELVFHISSQEVLNTYREAKRILNGNDKIVFDAMASITANDRNPFALPANSSEYDHKHQEIEERLKPARVLRGRQTAFRLMEEVVGQVQATGGVRGLTTDQLLKAIHFNTDQGAVIRITQELRWAAEWSIQLYTNNATDESVILLHVHSKDWGEVVPSYVVEYISSAIAAYKSKLNAAAVALLSIAMEATLRDVLATKGYQFTHGASSVDTYCYVNADVSLDGNAYLVTFKEPTTKPPADFTISTGGTNNVAVKIRRKINSQKNNRIELHLLTPPELIDHWSSNTVERPAQKNIGGLGEAIRIARDVEKILMPKDFPLDLDEVIKAVRNNLIHLSGDALEKTLPIPDASGNSITLGQFLKEPEMVYDLLTSVPRFINGQYIELRSGGHLVT